MSINGFGNKMVEKLREILGSLYIIEYKEVVKNNGTIYHAILVKKESEKIAPTIYIDDDYKAFTEGVDIDTLVYRFVKIYKENAVNGDFDVSSFTDFSKACKHFTFKVIGYDKNRQQLRDIPYKKIHDLALVPVCMIKSDSLGEGSITIKNDHMKYWEVSFDELWENVYEYAEENSPVSIESILHTLGHMVPGNMCDSFLKDMLVISNESKLKGASAIFYPGVMERIADRFGGDFVIIPSSIHEVIALCLPTGVDISGLVSMVREVNSTVVSDEEVLSDSVYLYDHKSKELKIYSE